MVCIVRLPVNVNVHSMFCNSWVVVDFVFVDEGKRGVPCQKLIWFCVPVGGMSTGRSLDI